MIPDPAARPFPKVGDDLGVLARRFADYGDENAARLRAARRIYEGVAERYSSPEE